MKQTILLAAIIAFVAVIKPGSSDAQVHVNVNIGMQPAWGPAGYDYAEYYYMPDIDVYYDVLRREFIYFDDGRWMFGLELPYRFRGYDFYSGYKVVINERYPWLRCDYYRSYYAPYRNYNGRQVMLRDRRDYGDYKGNSGYGENRSYGSYGGNGSYNRNNGGSYERRYDNDDKKYERRDNSRERRDNDDYATNKGRGYVRDRDHDHDRRH